MLNWSGWILGYILYVPRNPALFKPIGLALSVLKWQVHVTCFQDTNQWFRRQGRKYSTQSAITFLTDSIRRDMDVRVRFFGKIQIRISESKNGFWVFLGISRNGSWIHKIHTQGGFFGSNPNPDFWDSQSERFFGERIWKVFLTSGFSQKKMVWTYVCGVLLSLSHIIPCFVIYSNYW